MTRDELEQLYAARPLVSVGKLPVRDAVACIERSLPTTGHAMQLFDAVLARMGDRFVEDLGHPIGLRAIVAGDGDWLVPWPVIELGLGPPSPGDPERAAPELGPRGAQRRSARLAIHEGGERLSIQFDDNGLPQIVAIPVGDWWSYSNHPELPARYDRDNRPPRKPPMSMVLRDDLDPRGVSIDALADMILALDPKRTGARVRIKDPVGFGTRGCVLRALPGLRRALFSTAIPESARFLVCDGYEGVAISYGATSSEALDGFAAALFRNKPKRPAHDLNEPDDDGAYGVTIHEGPKVVEHDAEDGKRIELGRMKIGVRFPPPSLGFPRVTPATIPLVLLPLPQVPELPDAARAAGLARWARVVDERGDVANVLVRDDERGMTAVGEGVLDCVDLATLDDALDEAERAEEEATPAEVRDDPLYRGRFERPRFLHFGVWDALERQPTTPRVAGGAFGGVTAVDAYDGAKMAWAVTRARHQG